MARRYKPIHNCTKDLRKKIAKELGVTPDEVLDRLRAMKPKQAHLNDALEHFEEAAVAHRNRLRWVDLS